MGARLIAAALLLVLGGVGVVADAALRRQARAEERAVRADARGRARLLASSLRAELAELEEAVAAGEASGDLLARRIRVPPERRVGRYAQPAFGERAPAALALAVGATDATPSGLPVAVVAALALEDPEARDAVGVRLLAGELPVRSGDLALLAERLGLEDLAGVAGLRASLEEWSSRASTPSLPAFARELRASELVGWSRDGEEALRYAIPLAALGRRAALPEGSKLESLATAQAIGRLLVDVEGVDGLVLSVPLADVPSVTPWRVGSWVLVLLLGVVGLVALRSLLRERAALERERDFLTMVSHEMRTPLASVRVLGETLAEGRGDPKDYGELIAREGLRLTGLVEGVLAAARAEEKAVLSELEPGALLREVTELVRPRAEKRGVDLRVRIEELPRVSWDADRVRRAVLGLLDNALRHGCRDGGRCALLAETSEGEVRISVEDDGPGIGRADVSRIRGRFERAGETAGTGLGLWLAEQAAASHGGRLELETAPGEGARFTLHLPIRPKAEGEGA